MIEVISTAGLAVLQDLGRPGWQQLGISRSGAADRNAHRLANRLVGNRESAATIELTLGGLAFRTLSALTVAATGARCPGLGWNSAVTLAASTVIALGRPAHGLRSYLAIRGGIAVAPVLGSRSTDTLSGLGPPPVVAGARLPAGTEVVADPADEALLGAGPSGPLQVVHGPRSDWFDDPDELYRRPWQVGADTDRIGIRLAGVPLARRRDELPSEPVLPGAIQVPPSGQPIVLFRDAPVTGGYPVIGVVHSGELDRLAQLRPGQDLRFVRRPDSPA